MQGIDENIYVELYILSQALMLGVAATAAYDILRIIRRVIHHNIIFVSVEDLIFWGICALITFKMFYDYNGGIIRVHVICAVLLGIVLYHISLSGVLVKYISLILNEIVKLILKVLNFLSNKVKIDTRIIGTRKILRMRVKNEKKCFGKKKKKIE